MTIAQFKIMNTHVDEHDRLEYLSDLYHVKLEDGREFLAEIHNCEEPRLPFETGIYYDAWSGVQVRFNEPAPRWLAIEVYKRVDDLLNEIGVRLGLMVEKAKGSYAYDY